MAMAELMARVVVCPSVKEDVDTSVRDGISLDPGSDPDLVSGRLVDVSVTVVVRPPGRVTVIVLITVVLGNNKFVDTTADGLGVVDPVLGLA